AWTWEHMALTRMAYAAGDVSLADRAIDIARGAIDGRKLQPNIAADVDDMRERLRREKAPAGTWDIKLMQGGLIDIEFFAQKRLLLCGGKGAIAPNTYAALQYLAEQDQAEASDVAALQAAWTFQTSLRQVLKLALSETPSEPAFSEGLKSRLCRAVGLQRFEDVEGTLSRHYDTVMQIV
ncbi:MAG: glutamine-synthetase adenylyltransferase, partial [Pseudomonadota bacterium]